jgi:F0F1-type ATP synthase membrane subunit a
MLILGKREGTFTARIERVETRRRGFFGTIFWWVFLAFNVLLGLWLFYAIKISSEHFQATADAAAQAGTAIGGTLAVGILLWLWVMGDVILGLLVLLSRGKKVTIERTIE